MDRGPFELTQIEPGCYASAGVPSPASLSCQCHISCSACGYGGDQYSPTGAADCITCADGSPVTPIFGDGTGTCSFTGQPAPPPVRGVGGAQDGAVDAAVEEFESDEAEKPESGVDEGTDENPEDEEEEDESSENDQEEDQTG